MEELVQLPRGHAAEGWVGLEERGLFGHNQTQSDKMRHTMREMLLVHFQRLPFFLQGVLRLTIRPI